MGRSQDRVAWSTAIGLALIGAVLMPSYPAGRYFAAREHADIARAAASIFSTPLTGLQGTGDRTFEMQVPDDDQWHRIERRLRPPTFIVMAVTGRPQYGYPESVPGLHARVWRDRTELPLKPMKAFLHSGEGDAFEFTANRGDRLTISLRSDVIAVPLNSSVVVAPNWDMSWLWSWGEGAAAGDIVLPFGGIVLSILGVGLVLWAANLALGRPTLI